VLPAGGHVNDADLLDLLASVVSHAADRRSRGRRDLRLAAWRLCEDGQGDALARAARDLLAVARRCKRHDREIRRALLALEGKADRRADRHRASEELGRRCAMFGGAVSGRTVRRAEELKRRDPSLAEAVYRGELKSNKALRMARALGGPSSPTTGSEAA
jgi:hypothetical protein